MSLHRIEDAGEQLAGARKAESEGRHERASTTSSQDGTTLASIWAIPEKETGHRNQWQTLAIELGPYKASRIMCVYPGLADTPKSYTNPNLKTIALFAFRKAIEIIRSLLEDDNKRTLKDISEEYNRQIVREVSAEAQRLQIPNITKNDIESIAIYAAGKQYRRKTNHPFGLSPIDSMRFETLSHWGWGVDPAIPDRLAMGPLLLTSRVGGRQFWRSVKGVSGGWEILDKKEFATSDEALANTEQYVCALLGTPIKERAPRPQVLWVRESLTHSIAIDSGEIRTGFDAPSSSGKTSHDLIAKFRFRGVEFGNYVTQSQRKWFVNECFDALSDLAYLLGFPSEFISLQGKLGIAYGSRGEGMLNNAAAHFEPENLVLHLTRDQGPGSLAHEYGHALDYLIGSFIKNNGRIAFSADTEFGSILARNLISARFSPAISSLIEAYNDWEELGSWTHAQSWIQESRQMDAGSRKNYWSDPAELFARGFEVMIYDAMQLRSKRNLMLVNGISEAQGIRLHAENKNFPYPLGAERRTVCQLMARIVRAFKVCAQQTN